MKANIGTLDRTLRIAVGLCLIVLSLLGVIGVWGWVGLVPLATGAVRFCTVRPTDAQVGRSTVARTYFFMAQVLKPSRA